MPDIRPMRALLYNAEKVGDMNKVMAPPYDVISPGMQDELYNKHPNNIVRLEYGKIYDNDAEGGDRYSRAAVDFRKWIDEGVLLRDALPAIYYYCQIYKDDAGLSHTRKGFTALTKLEEFGKGRVHPHEKTLSGPKADRLKLMNACSANFSPIFSIYSDPALTVNAILDKATAGTKAAIDVVDKDGIVNKVWRVADPSVISAVCNEMKGRALFIADGHHRYETAINYRNRMREDAGKYTDEEPYNFIMMYFSNMDDEGMTIWPTHRIIHSLPDFDGKRILKECANYFNVERLDYTQDSEEEVAKAFVKKLEGMGEVTNAFGLHIKGDDSFYLLAIKSKDTMDKVFGASIPEVFKNLDVTVLHSLIFAKVLGITQEAQEKQTNLIYVKSTHEALDAVKKDEMQLVFLLNATKIGQVKSVAEAGFVMPQKSTYFYPKLLSGLLLNQLSGDAI